LIFKEPKKASIVDAFLDRSRAIKPALPSHRVQNAAASTASHPNVRDDRNTPLMRDGTAKILKLIWSRGNGNIFENGARRAKSQAPADLSVGHC
jgi:hypothetical protein